MIAAIALGSNLASRWGDPAETLREALHRLRGLGEVTAVSSFYDTEPVGVLEQPRFINAAALLRTSLGPLEVLRSLLAIEEAMGRMRSADLPPKGPRIIDLDLLLCENDQGHGILLDDPDLILPHPAMHERRFVLEPLAEIAPAMRHPGLGRGVKDLLSAL